MNTDTRSEKLAWIAAILGALAFVCALLLVRLAGLAPPAGASIAGGVVAALSILTVLRARFARTLARQEAQFAEFSRRRTEGSDLFEGADSALRMAQRADLQFVKYGAPVAALLTGLAVTALAVVLWRGWPTPDALRPCPFPLRAAALQAGFLVACLVAGSYFNGVSREPGCRWLRPCATWMLFTAFPLALGLTDALAQQFQAGPDGTSLWLARIALGATGILGLEMALTAIVDWYRPRLPHEEARPVFESRLLSLVCEPGGIARNVGASLDYQFGFRVSEASFYRFVERTFVPMLVVMAGCLWLLTSLKVIQAEETGIRERFGRVVSSEPLRPGLHVKLPYPFAAIRTFPVEQVQKVAIGYRPATQAEIEENLEYSAQTILWTKRHNVEEASFVVASEDLAQTQPVAPDEDRPVPVYLVSASIPLYFRVTDLHRYLYEHDDPNATLERVAHRELARFMAGMDFFGMFSGMEVGAERLRRAIQSRAEELHLGIEVVFVGLEGLHPPVDVGEAFDDVVAAMEDQHATVLDAETYAIGKRPAAEGQAAQLEAEARAHQFRVERVARTEAARFHEQLVAFQAAPELFVLNSYLDVLENEAKTARKYVIATDGREVHILDLEEKLRPDLLDVDLDAPQP